MTKECCHCHALKWDKESKGLCCCNGKVKLELLRAPEEPLYSLFNGEHPDSNHFLTNIRSYNSCFQMTSFGANVTAMPGFMPTFRVQGQVYHQIGSLLPVDDQPPRFLQIYFIGDERAQAERRRVITPLVRLEVIEHLQTLLHRNNSYVQSLLSAMEMVPQDQDWRIVIRADGRPPGEHERRYNPPAADEVAIAIVGQDFHRRDIVLQQRDHGLQRISAIHRSYDALQYPLLFSLGEDGYNISVFQVDAHGMPTNSIVSCMNFYAYRMMVRSNEFNHLLRGGRLLLQYQVDMFAKMETERLNYLRHSQQRLRAAAYTNLRDAVASDGSAVDVGQRIILPSSHTGSNRYFHERQQDAMTYVSVYGRPDLFITLTCNPKWREIQESLFERQSAHDRHDIIARVFHQKVDKLIDVLDKEKLFGPVRAYTSTVEWQKRGLPHIHLLLFLTERPRPADIDSLISAELPDPETDQGLFDIVKRSMIHGPCGVLNPNSPCMREGRCQKRYPKSMVPETIHGEDSYPQYRRRTVAQGGHAASLPVRGQETTIDNRWVVPHSPILLKMFDAHINVEFCHSVKAIKYICKYIHKGSDQAVFAVANDEILEYQNGRYVSSNEACWRLFGYAIHKHYPPVIQLAVHLENGQRVYFDENNMLERAQQPPRTTLTSFFEICSTDEFAHTLYYKDMPHYYTLSSNRWLRRKRGDPVDGIPGVFRANALGRIYVVHPRHFECYYLRILLNHVIGPRSFQELRSVDGEVQATYREACFKRGLLEDDAHWNSALEEAGLTQSPARLRYLFSIMITVCDLANPMELWERHRDNMCDDILRRYRITDPEANYSDQIYNEGLLLIDSKVRELTGRTVNEYGLPSPVPREHDALNAPNDIARELNYDHAQLAQMVEANVETLVEDQARVYNHVANLIERNEGGIVFLDAPGGTGKTYLLNLLLAKVRRDGDIALAVASSGIAATLLDGGKTAHSMFRLPLNTDMNENPVCNIAQGTIRAELLTRCRLIVWDECTMSHKFMFEALNRTLCDIRNIEDVMGGVLVILAGDFRQTLPVVPNGTPADELRACLKSSNLWIHIHTMKLRTNMRVHLHGDHTAGEFSEVLLSIGDG